MITPYQATRMAKLHWKHLELEPVSASFLRDGIFELHDPRVPQTVFVIDGRHHTLDFPVQPEFATEIVNQYSNRVVQFEGPDSFRYCEPAQGSEFARSVPIYFTEERPT